MPASASYKERQKRAIRLWRKCKFPRLYWRTNNRNWRTWDNDAIAMFRDGAVRVSFKNLAAIEDLLIENNAGEK